MTTATIDRPAPHAQVLRRGQCLGKRNPDCTANIHGTSSAYKAGCRCPHARNANRIYEKRRREGRNTPRLIDATGTHRRIQALWALGHTSTTIGEAAGLSEHHVQRIVYAREFVTYNTWQLIDGAFRTLSTVPGTSDRTRSRARKAGYAPPLAWDDIDDPDEQPKVDAEPTDDGYDETTVAQACEGRLTYEQLAAHRPDLIETVRRLARTLHDVEIGHLLRWPGCADTRTGPGHRRATKAGCAIEKLRRDNGIPGKPRWESQTPQTRKAA
ncbi:hypothetical protein ACFOOK_28235 [Micromonospora krabiensis]|uniref:Uncharacterized protein n=1 Tax=Micromonospora krabiensis TaxID=307121 RepID=A0A1C3N4N1_9ACTN|nr:hypothetical protein [Micromonospora krabiensis]SBV27541.1 hypothetical protein GA0070620_3065 [Micromonospora krabiensis]